MRLVRVNGNKSPLFISLLQLASKLKYCFLQKNFLMKKKMEFVSMECRCTLRTHYRRDIQRLCLSRTDPLRVD